jgi:cytochrome c oxidase cbb3-type subunit 4
MDIGTIQAIGTVLAFIAFVAVCVWAYSGKQKQRFIEAANLPFADEHLSDCQQDDRGNQA